MPPCQGATWLSGGEVVPQAVSDPVWACGQGCGDKAMVLKLVQLGTDVNCRDSVGGAHVALGTLAAQGL